MEKRQFERTPCEFETSFRSLVGETPGSLNETVVKDISEGGIRFRSNHFIPVHHKLLFKINVPNRRPIEAVAQPAWIRDIPGLDQFELGAKFISLSEADREIIRQLIQHAPFEI